MTGMQLSKVLKDTQHALAHKWPQGMTPQQRHAHATERIAASKKRTYRMMEGPIPKDPPQGKSLNLRECYR